MESHISGIQTRDEFLPGSDIVRKTPMQTPTLQLATGNAKMISRITKESQFVPFCGLNLATLSVINGLFNSYGQIAKSYRAKPTTKRESEQAKEPYPYELAHRCDDDKGQKKNVYMQQPHTFAVSAAPIAGFIALDAIKQAQKLVQKESTLAFTAQHYLYCVLRFLHITCSAIISPDSLGEILRDTFSLCNKTSQKQAATRPALMRCKLMAAHDALTCDEPISHPKTLDDLKLLDFETLEDMFFFLVHAKNIHLRPEQIMNFSDAIKHHSQGISNSGIDVALDEFLSLFKTIPQHEKLKITPADTRYMSIYEKYKALEIIRKHVQHLTRNQRHMLLDFDHIETAYTIKSLHAKQLQNLDELIVETFLQIPSSVKIHVLSITAEEIAELSEYKHVHLFNIAFAKVLQEGQAQEKVRFEKMQKNKGSSQGPFYEMPFYEILAKTLQKHLSQEEIALLLSALYAEYPHFSMHPQELALLIHEVEKSLDIHKNTPECEQIRHALFILKEFLDAFEPTDTNGMDLARIFEKIDASVMSEACLLQASRALTKTNLYNGVKAQNVGPLLDRILSKKATLSEHIELLPYCTTYIQTLLSRFGVPEDELQRLFSLCTRCNHNLANRAICCDPSCVLQETISKLCAKEKKKAYKKVQKRVSELFGKKPTNQEALETLSQLQWQRTNQLCINHVKQVLDTLTVCVHGVRTHEPHDEAFLHFFQKIHQNTILPYMAEVENCIRQSDTVAMTDEQNPLLMQERTWFLLRYIITEIIWYFAGFVQDWVKANNFIDPLRVENFIKLTTNEKNTLWHFLGKKPQKIENEQIPTILKQIDQKMQNKRVQNKSLTVDKFLTLSPDAQADILFIVSTSKAYTLYRDEDTARIVTSYNCLPAPLQPISCPNVMIYESLSMSDQERIRLCNALGARFLQSVTVSKSPRFAFVEFQNLKKASKHKLKVLLQIYAGCSLQEKAVLTPSACKKMSHEKLMQTLSYVLQHAASEIQAFGTSVDCLRRLASDTTPLYARNTFCEILATLASQLSVDKQKSLLRFDVVEHQRQLDGLVQKSLQRAFQKLQEKIQRVEKRLRVWTDLKYMVLGLQINSLEQQLTLSTKQIQDIRNIIDSLQKAAEYNPSQIHIDKEKIAKLKLQQDASIVKRSCLKQQLALCKEKQNRVKNKIYALESYLEELTLLQAELLQKPKQSSKALFETNIEQTLREALFTDLCERLFETFLANLTEHVSNPISFEKKACLSYKTIDVFIQEMSKKGMSKKPHQVQAFITLKKQLKQRVEAMHREQREKLFQAQELLQKLAKRPVFCRAP